MSSTDSTGPRVLRARGLTKTFGSGDTAVHALRDVSLDVVQGEFMVLLGASGSGKSTLLNILGGLDRPTSGEISFQDHVLTTASDEELARYRRENIGFVSLIDGPRHLDAIDRAIAGQPQLLLCDEPTGLLDQPAKKRVVEDIEKLNLERGTTVIVITHDAAIAGMADRVVRLAHGRIASIDRPLRPPSPAELSR